MSEFVITAVSAQLERILEDCAVAGLGCKFELWPLDGSLPARTIERKEGRPALPAPAEPIRQPKGELEAQRLCPHCSKPLRKDNRRGVCTKCATAGKALPAK
jgi:uncharacterized paraquat-inducible protein A